MRCGISATILCLAACLFVAIGNVSSADNPVPVNEVRKLNPVLGDDGYPTNETVAAEQGRAEARRDLTNGVVIVKFAGLPSMEAGTYWRLLSERCGVSTQPIAGCRVTSGLDAYCGGYNEVSVAWVKQKFGTNIFNEIWEDARKEYQKEVEVMYQAWLKNESDAQRGLDSKNVYRVQPGDTFAKIAKLKKIPLRELMNANPGIDPKKLQINQKLVLPK